MLPNGTAIIIDAKRYKALFEEGIQLVLPEQSNNQRIFLINSKKDGQQQHHSQKSIGGTNPAEEVKTIIEDKEIIKNDVFLYVSNYKGIN